MKAITTVWFLLVLTGAAFSATIVVPDNYPTIQGAIDAAADGDLVVVRGGIWVENIDFGGKAIQVRSLAGAKNTIIDGGQAGSVVTFNGGEGSASILYGFTLYNGSASYGGGIYCGANVSPVISDNVIGRNGATSGGGGIYCYDGSRPRIKNNTITENWVASGNGGGVYFRDVAAPVIEGNAIADNAAQGSGGGIYGYHGGAATIAANTISGNQCGTDGGGIYLYENAVASITGNTVSGNQSNDDGGGIYVYNGAPLTIAGNIVAGNACNDDGGGIYDYATESLFRDNEITDNTAQDYGGGVYTSSNGGGFLANTIAGNSGAYGGGFHLSSCEAWFVDNVVTGNVAAGHGGGLYSATSIGDLRDNTFAHNMAALDGGGIYFSSSAHEFEFNRIEENSAGYNGGGLYIMGGGAQNLTSDLLAANVAGFYGGGLFCDGAKLSATCLTVTGNSAGAGGGGAVCFAGGELSAANSIFWGNAAPQGPEISLLSNVGYNPSAAELAYTDVAGGQTSVFVDVNCTLDWGTGMIDADPLFCDPANGDYRLQQDPCEPGVANPCVDTGDPDPGAMIAGSTRSDGELDTDVVDMGFHHFDIVISGTCYVPDNFPTIQSAIDGTIVATTIIVRPGTYLENISFHGRAVTVRSERGADVTVIDGGAAARVVSFVAGEGRDSVIDGFTITNGLADLGGGIRCENAMPTIINNVIVANRAASGGGGIHLRNCSALVANNVIARNEVSGASGRGAGVDCRLDDSLLVNNTIAGNATLGGGGGLCVRQSSGVTVVNTILWNNYAPSGPEAWIGNVAYPSVLTISDSDVMGGQASVQVETGSTLTWGAGMIDADPLFADANLKDWHLTDPSPCRNAGTASAPGLTLYDREGDRRIWWDGAVDIGADEYQYHLYFLGQAVPGNPIHIRVIGMPGDDAVLALGSAVRDEPYKTEWGDVWLELPYTPYSIGQVPASGVLVLPVNVPGSWTSGTYPFQAWLPGRITNLMVLSVP